MIDREELLQIIRREWPAFYERGLISHLHRNHVVLADGTQIHLRVLVQQLRVEDYREAEP